MVTDHLFGNAGSIQLYNFLFHIILTVSFPTHERDSSTYVLYCILEFTG